ncbi:uncharacterized protein K441DRAFT_691749 [Cenococcum geophilum 1.58]|uniref:uncharacterized protein n=1 Tax=Cenococcum geophilum 1.58 TaxID=794803 RepID=UPI00358E72EC|nr:hypothetical protein K441DRAFT_691749 [Cenococcum geophilum 1.58]
MSPKTPKGASGKGKAKREREKSAKEGNIALSAGAATPKPKKQRIGTTHQVKGEDRTGTKWDNENYETLRRGCRERGLLHRNLKKAQLAKQLAEDDARNDVAAVEKRRRETQQKIQEEVERKRKEVDKAERIAQREQQRNEGGNETDEGYLINLYDRGITGELITLSGTATTTETATRSSMSSPYHPNIPYQTLSVFEWPYPELPSPSPPKTPTTPHYDLDSPMHLIASTPPIQPVRMKYKYMFLQTTKSNEGVALPGKKTPPNLSPDFVPRPSPEAVQAARNGVRIKQLRRTKIESGKDWNKRTQLQWWNGGMFLEDFQIPKEWDADQPSLSEAPSPGAAETTSPTSRSKSVSRSKSRSRSRSKKLQSKAKLQLKSKPARGQNTSERNRKQLALEAASSTIRSKNPVLYLPACLDMDNDDGFPHTLDRLFYITYLDQEMPHFFFWTRPGDWEDPTQENPEYNIWKAQDRENAKIEEDILDSQIVQRETDDAWGRAEDLESNMMWFQPVPLSRTRVRVRKPRTTLGPISTDLKYYSKFKDPKLERAICVAEEMLIRKGLRYTLGALRKRYEADAGDHEHWDQLTERLLRLYPAGKLPEAPPVHVKEMRDGSVALKIAELENGQPPSPLRGDEPWTRNDDRYWDIVRKRPIPDEKLGFLNDVARKRKRRTSLCSSEDLPCKRLRFHQDAYDSKCYDGEQPLQRPFDDLNGQATSISTRKTTQGKKAAGLGVNVSFALSTVEKRTAYNDNVGDVDDVAADGDLDTPIASTKSNTKRTTSAAANPIKSVLCRPTVEVMAPPAMKAKKTSSSKVHRLSPTTTTVRSTTTRTGHRKTQHIDPTHEDSPSPSPTTPSPVLRIPKRKPHDHPFRIRKVSLAETSDGVSPLHKPKKHDHPFRIRKVSLAETSDGVSPLHKPKKKIAKTNASSTKAKPVPVFILPKKKKPDNKAFEADIIKLDASNIELMPPVKKTRKIAKTSTKVKGKSSENDTITAISRSTVKVPVKPKIVAAAKKLEKPTLPTLKGKILTKICKPRSQSFSSKRS